MILLGEMRDLETIATALTAAETGHLVFATLHTQSAPSTIDRIIDVFPAAQQDQVRMQLANTLAGDRHPDADAEGRRLRPRVRARDPLPRRRDPEPDPSGQDRAGLLVHADRHAARHADDGAVAARARPEAPITVLDALSRSSRPEALVSALERAGIPIPVMSNDGASAPPWLAGLRVAGS